MKEEYLRRVREEEEKEKEEEKKEKNKDKKNDGENHEENHDENHKKDDEEKNLNLEMVKLEFKPETIPVESPNGKEEPAGSERGIHAPSSK